MPIRRILAVILAAAFIVGIPVAASGGTLPKVAHFTIDATPELQVAADEAAAGWNKGTVLDLTTGTCSGAGCVTVVIDDASCGEAGCAIRNADGSCLVQITTAAMAYGPKLERAIVAHEVGHCAGLGHSDVERDVMYGILSGPRPQWITTNDRTRMNAAHGY